MTRKGNVLYKCQWTAKKIYISTEAEIEGEQNVKVRNGVHSVRINAFAHLEWNYLYLCEIWWEQLLQNSRLISSTPNRCIIYVFMLSQIILIFFLHEYYTKENLVQSLVWYLEHKSPPPIFLTISWGILTEGWQLSKIEVNWATKICWKQWYLVSLFFRKI